VELSSTARDSCGGRCRCFSGKEFTTTTPQPLVRIKITLQAATATTTPIVVVAISMSGLSPHPSRPRPRTMGLGRVGTHIEGSLPPTNQAHYCRLRKESHHRGTVHPHHSRGASLFHPPERSGAIFPTGVAGNSRPLVPSPISALFGGRCPGGGAVPRKSRRDPPRNRRGLSGHQTRKLGCHLAGSPGIRDVHPEGRHYGLNILAAVMSGGLRKPQRFLEGAPHCHVPVRPLDWAPMPTSCPRGGCRLHTLAALREGLGGRTWTLSPGECPS